MLRSVLTKLVECMEAHNQYVLQGPPTVANHYAAKCELLIECLEDAGYKPIVKTETVDIFEGLYRGCRNSLYTSISFYVPIVPVDENDKLRLEMNVFANVGFECPWNGGTMTYEFNNCRKENTAWAL